MTERNLDHVRAWIKCADWTFAKTAAETPHEYVVIRGGDRHFLNWFGPFTREHGYPQKFMGRTYWYLDVDGYRYWASSNFKGIWFINRAEGHADGRADEPIRQ